MDGIKSTRYLLLLFGIIIFLAGGTLLAAGLMFKFDSGFLDSKVINLFNMVIYESMPPMGVTCDALSYIMAAVGGVMMFVSLLGMCGALKSAKSCLWVFIVLVVMFIILQGVMIGLWVAVRTKTDLWLRGRMMSLLADYAGPEETDATSAGWNNLFRKARCCGVNAQYENGGTNNDFKDIPSTWVSATDNVPATCCQGVTEDTISTYVGSASCVTGPTNFYTEGCYSRVKFYIDTYSLLTIIACGVAILAQVLGIVASCVLIDKARSNKVQISDLASEAGSKPPPYVAIDRWMQVKKAVDDGKMKNAKGSEF